MKNVKLEQKGKLLIITVDLTQDFGPSSSGKTTIVATTAGAVAVGDVKVGLNVYRGKA